MVILIHILFSHLGSLATVGILECEQFYMVFAYAVHTLMDLDVLTSVIDHYLVTPLLFLTRTYKY